MIVAVILLLGILDGPSELVLHDGGTIPIREIVVVENDRLLYRDALGTLYSIPLHEVDLEGTTDPHRKPVTRRSQAVSTTDRKPPLPALRVSAEEKERILHDLEKNARQAVPLERSTEPQSAKGPLDDLERPTEAVEDESEWREQARRLRNRIDDSRSSLEEARRRERELNDFILFVAGSSGNADGYARYVAELADVRENIPRLETALKRAEEAYSSFTELARRRGILPGWLR